VSDRSITAASLYAQSGYRLVVLRHLDPKLERDRSRDGSCVNLSAVARNAKRLEEASHAWVDHSARRIICPTHVYEALRRSLPDGRT
jgi:hypothetical protein